MNAGPLESVPFLIVVSGPSGAGKTSITRRVVERNSDIYYSVSLTTRPNRGGERDGVDYRFITEDEFREKVDAGEFLEWARVHGAYYGTPKTPIERALAGGKKVLLDIDVQGGSQIRGQVDHGLYIFVVPPTRDVLLRRLRGRGTDDPEVIRRRMEEAGREIEEMRFYQYLVVNDDLEDSVARVEGIIRAEESRIQRIRGLDGWIQAFQDR